MTTTKTIFLFLFVLSATFVFGQKKYERIRTHPFYYDNTDSILKQTLSDHMDFRLYYFDKHNKSITVSSTIKPFPYDFQADSCTIYKSRLINVQDFRLSDSVSTFTYSIKYVYKSNSSAKKDLKYLCEQFNIAVPKTKGAINKLVYFELDNAFPICISHNIQIGQIEKLGNFYSFYLTFTCEGERDNRNYVNKKK